MPDEPGSGEVYEFTLDEYDADERIDQVLSARLPDLSRTHIQKLIRDGKLTVDETELEANNNQILYSNISEECDNGYLGHTRQYALAPTIKYFIIK